MPVGCGSTGASSRVQHRPAPPEWWPLTAQPANRQRWGERVGDPLPCHSHHWCSSRSVKGGDGFAAARPATNNFPTRFAYFAGNFFESYRVETSLTLAPSTPFRQVSGKGGGCANGTVETSVTAGRHL